MTHPATSSTTRRALLAGGAAVAGLAAAGPTFAATGTGPGAHMRERATALLNAFDDQQRDRAVFPFEGNRRKAWNFMLGSRKAPGVALEDMTPDQKVAAMDLLGSGLGEAGMLKAERIMLQQDIMRDEWGKGSPDRNRERFSVQIYGEPSATAPWTFRFEGHHLSVTFTMVGDEIVSVTPSAFSSEPNPVPSGPHKGLVVLEEENIGRAIFGAMSPGERERALIRASSFGNIMSTRGREARVGAQREGIALADLSTGLSDEIIRLIEVFSSDNLSPALKSREEARLREGDLMGAHFGWAGDDRGPGSIYYRITGDTFLIEFATLRNQPLHHHAVRHDIARNYGDHAL
ncbi:MAG: DUF3500 domain-containing protein [Pseudomonadota bacterium]